MTPHPISRILWLTGAGLYFVVPLMATTAFSLSGPRPFAAYRAVLQSPGFWHGLILSLGLALVTVVGGILVILPAAFWVHWKGAAWKPWVDAVSLMPFVVPPIVLVMALMRFYGAWAGRPILLTVAYITISLPYLYRTLAAGMTDGNLPRLVEAALGLGAGWPTILVRVVMPALRTALLGGTFLVMALILGEYAIASMLGYNTFGVYMELTGETAARPAAALAVLSFIWVWALTVVVTRLSGPRTGQPV
ncbi:MAG: ABC transporter permease subunit [Sulfobacillus sp.]|nr:ABC transporter permease subunit [Sulfobacillus sp.]